MGMTGGCTPGHVVVRDATELTGSVAAGGGRTGLVAVVDGDADAWLGSNRTVVGDADAVGVVSLGESVRSTATEAGQEMSIPELTGIPDVGDLAALGRVVSDTLASYESRGLTPVVVFDAVETLLEATSLEATFRVLHLVSARTRLAGGSVVTVLPETMRQDAVDTLSALAD